MNKTSLTTLPATATLHSLADTIQGQARHFENLATLRSHLERLVCAAAAGELAHRTEDLLRLQQCLRAAGQGDPDEAFFTIAWLTERWGEEILATDPELNRLFAELSAIEQREGLSEFEEFDPDHPDAPADWKALTAEYGSRFQEVMKIRDERHVQFLRSHGENDMADMYVNDRAEYARRREAGRLIVFGPVPDEVIAVTEGDTGLTSVT